MTQLTDRIVIEVVKNPGKYLRESLEPLAEAIGENIRTVNMSVGVMLGQTGAGRICVHQGYLYPGDTHLVDATSTEPAQAVASQIFSAGNTTSEYVCAHEVQADVPQIVAKRQGIPASIIIQHDLANVKRVGFSNSLNMNEVMWVPQPEKGRLIVSSGDFAVTHTMERLKTTYLVLVVESKGKYFARFYQAPASGPFVWEWSS